MEIHLPFIFTTLIIISSLIILLINFCFKNKISRPHMKTSTKLPPSPPKLPIIGHLHHLVGKLPHRALTELAIKYGPVLHLQLGQVPAVVISSPEAAEQVVKIQDPACADRPQSIGTKIMWYDYTDIAFSPYNEYWRQMRKICILELLSAKNVKSFASIRQDEATRLVKSLELSSGKVVNLTKMVAASTSSVTCRAAFGKVIKDRDELISMLSKAVTMSGGFELADLFPSSKLLNALCWNKHRLLKMRKKLDVILDRIVEEHKLKQSGEFGAEDIVDTLLRMQRCEELEFPISNHNIKAIIFDMFSAGTETSSSALDWAMSELIRNPRVMAKAQAEIRQTFKGNTNTTIIEQSSLKTLKYLKLVIKETLRLHPPIPLLPRACREECQVNGYTIPLKFKVLVNVWSMARDPKYWGENAHEFKPERFEEQQHGIINKDFLGNDFEFLPFGGGRRMCPGMGFALASIELSLACLLYYFNWELPENVTRIEDHVDMSEVNGIAVSRKNALLVVPRINCSPDLRDNN